MSLIRMGFIRAAMSWGVLWTALTLGAPAQAISTTTVQGTVYLANGTPGSGTLQVSWPAFTTAQNQAVAAGKAMVEIGADGFMSVNLAPNLGSSPAGLFYTAIYHMSDGTTSTEYWPGDALAIDAPSTGISGQVIVRSVKLNYHASLPDVVGYEIGFANDWAEDLAIRTGSVVPTDAWLPAPVAPTYLANLGGLSVMALSGQSVTIDAGTVAPAGGGFEIRRRDNCFMPGYDADLIMRSSQPMMTISRSSAWDRFYIRMFDGSNPPNYSEFSAALTFNLPLAS